MSAATAAATEAQPQKIYIHELASLVNRRENTIRGWCRSIDGAPPRLPAHLLPTRAPSKSGEGWRYWTPAQVEGIRQWMVENNMLPGAGLRNFNPDEANVGQLLERLRGRRIG